MKLIVVLAVLIASNAWAMNFTLPDGKQGTAWIEIPGGQGGSGLGGSGGGAGAPSSGAFGDLGAGGGGAPRVPTGFFDHGDFVASPADEGLWNQFRPVYQRAESRPSSGDGIKKVVSDLENDLGELHSLRNQIASHYTNEYPEGHMYYASIKPGETKFVILQKLDQRISEIGVLLKAHFSKMCAEADKVAAAQGSRIGNLFRNPPHLRPPAPPQAVLEEIDPPIQQDPIPEIAVAAGIGGLGIRAAGNLCFTGDTLICVEANAASPIDNIQVGDWVQSCSITPGQEVPSCERRQVTKVFESTAHHLMSLSFQGQTIRTTDEHPFYVLEVKDWVPARDLAKGNHLKTISGDSVEIDQVRSVQGPFPVYNLEVEGTHTYYACGILVHNCNIIGALEEIFDRGTQGAAGGNSRDLDQSSPDRALTAPNLSAGQTQ